VSDNAPVPWGWAPHWSCPPRSQVVGLVMARYVVGVEPLAGLGRDDLARVLAPTFQRYLTGPLGRLQGA